MSTPLAFLVLGFAIMALWILDNERRAEQAQARRAARLAALIAPRPASRR